MASKHEFGRRTANRHAWIRIDGLRSQRCILKSVTDDGAVLACEHPALLPFLFEVEDQRDGWHERCQLGEVTEAGATVTFVPADEDFGREQEAETDELIEWTGDAAPVVAPADPERARGRREFLELHRPRRSPWAELAYAARRWLAGEVHLADMGIGQR